MKTSDGNNNNKKKGVRENKILIKEKKCPLEKAKVKRSKGTAS